jgi:hypothetical protein
MLQGRSATSDFAKIFKSPLALACAEIGISEQADACRSRSAASPLPPGQPPAPKAPELSIWIRRLGARSLVVSRTHKPMVQTPLRNTFLQKALKSPRRSASSGHVR